VTVTASYSECIMVVSAMALQRHYVPVATAATLACMRHPV